MGKPRGKYTKKFKEDAVEMLETTDKSGHQIEADLGIGSGQVYRWRKELSNHGPHAFPGNGRSRDQEMAELRKENAILRQERDILRKTIAIFSRTPK